MDETSTMDNYPVPPVERLIEEYCNSQLGSKHKATIEAYSRVLKQFATWLVGQPGSQEQFHPGTITRTVIEIFLGTLNSSSHKNLSRSVISSFCQWLSDEKQILERNPVLGINVPPQAFLAPRILNEKQRFAMHQIVERANDIRGEAIFALGYWAGCRVSDVSYLLM
jgi:site-specific recombinase XerD